MPHNFCSLKNKKWHGITHHLIGWTKHVWQVYVTLTENMDEGIVDANRIELYMDKIQILKFQDVKFKHLKIFRCVVCNLIKK